MKKNLTPILVALGILAVIVFVVFALTRPTSETSQNSDSPTSVNPTAEQQKQIVSGANRKGPANAKVVVTEFGDFQCPACGEFEKELNASILPKYGNSINFVFKHLPLSQIHNNALSAAYASEAAANQGKFWEMHDKLYATQTEWSELSDPQPKYDSFAAAIGLNVSKFKADMNTSAVKARVSADNKLADTLKLPGTPSFFVNGVFVTANTVTELSNAIDKALAQ